MDGIVESISQSRKPRGRRLGLRANERHRNGYGRSLQQSVESVLAVWALELLILKDLYELRGTEGAHADHVNKCSVVKRDRYV